MLRLLSFKERCPGREASGNWDVSCIVCAGVWCGGDAGSIERFLATPMLGDKKVLVIKSTVGPRLTGLIGGRCVRYCRKSVSFKNILITNLQYTGCIIMYKYE
jgi:hypothetical protein